MGLNNAIFANFGNASNHLGQCLLDSKLGHCPLNREKVCCGLRRGLVTKLFVIELLKISGAKNFKFQCPAGMVKE
jgi:hypothetical protein